MSAEGYRVISVGEATSLPFQSLFEDTGLFPQAIVYRRGSNTIVETLDFVHVRDGFYRVDFTPTTENEFDIIIKPWSNAGQNTLTNDGPSTIKIIAKDIVSQSKGTMGAMMLESDLEEIIRKTSRGVWEVELANGRKAAEELIAKSEFDFEEDVVKTDIVIKPLNFNELKTFLTEKVSTLEDNQKKLLDGRLEALAKAIKTGLEAIPEFNDKNIVESINEIRGSLQKNIDSQTKNLEEILLAKFSEIIQEIPKIEQLKALFSLEGINKKFEELEKGMGDGKDKVVEEIQRIDLEPLLSEQKLVKEQIEKFKELINEFNTSQGQTKKEILGKIAGILTEQSLVKEQVGAFARLVDTFSKVQGSIKEEILEEIVKLLNQLLAKIKAEPFDLDKQL